MLHTHTHNRLTALFPGLPGWAGTRKVKPIWILLKQETASGSGISWAICKSATRCRQTTMPAPHQLVFYMPDALPAKALKACNSQCIDDKWSVVAAVSFVYVMCIGVVLQCWQELSLTHVQRFVCAMYRYLSRSFRIFSYLWWVCMLN